MQEAARCSRRRKRQGQLGPPEAPQLVARARDCACARASSLVLVNVFSIAIVFSFPGGGCRRGLGATAWGARPEKARLLLTARPPNARHPKLHSRGSGMRSQAGISASATSGGHARGHKRPHQDSVLDSLSRAGGGLHAVRHPAQASRHSSADLDYRALGKQLA